MLVCIQVPIKGGGFKYFLECLPRIFDEDFQFDFLCVRMLSDVLEKHNEKPTKKLYIILILLIENGKNSQLYDPVLLGELGSQE